MHCARSNTECKVEEGTLGFVYGVGMWELVIQNERNVYVYEQAVENVHHSCTIKFINMTTY